MKVILVNGSPHKNGVTYTALEEIAQTLQAESIDTEIFQLGTKPIGGCIACGKCKVDHCCIFRDDPVNPFVERAQSAHGFIFGTPVHYAAASGNLTAFLDRVFYSGGRALSYKPGAAIACARRGGTTAALDQLNKYFTINNMPLVSSQYWNMVHGYTPEDAKQDLEGMQTMRRLGRNMAWLLKCIAAGNDAGITLPQSKEKRVMTNFIR